MGRGLLLPPADVMDPVGIGGTAESLGYESVWMPELWGSDAFVQLGILATETDEITLGTAITNVFSRSPAVIAMAAATVNRFSEGRMTLGTGVSTPKAIEDLHGMDYDQPIRRAHETIAIAKAYLSDDEPVSYDGKVFDVADFDTLGADVPIYHAAMGPANRRVVARLADGWIPHMIPFSHLEAAFEGIAETARDADRDPSEITVAPYVPAAVSDENPERAREGIRSHIAYYVGNGKGYQKAVEQVFPEQAQLVADHWRSDDRSAARDAVTDEMVAALGVAGTASEAREQLASLETAAVDEPIITVPERAAGDVALETIQALAPE